MEYISKMFSFFKERDQGIINLAFNNFFFVSQMASKYLLRAGAKVSSLNRPISRLLINAMTKFQTGVN
jgi:hypothetical protein